MGQQYTDHFLRIKAELLSLHGYYPVTDTAGLDRWGGKIVRMRASDAAAISNWFKDIEADYGTIANAWATFQDAIDEAESFGPADVDEIVAWEVALLYWNAWQDWAATLDGAAARFEAESANTLLRAFTESVQHLPETVAGAADSVIGGIVAAFGPLAMLVLLFGLIAGRDDRSEVS